MQVTFPQVWALLGQGREDMETYKESYAEMYQELRDTQPKENTQHMTIKFVLEAPQWSFFFEDQGDPEDLEAAETDNSEEAEEPEEEGETLQVYGFIPGDPEGYAIGQRPSEVLVGLDVDPETVRDYTPEEIVAHCLAEMTYTATVASSAYGTEKDMAGGGLLASQACMKEDIQNIDLEKLRQELGVLPKPEEDYRTKYGFLF
jgi:hypothetical protein